MLNLSDTIAKFHTVDIITILCYSHGARSYNQYIYIYIYIYIAQHMKLVIHHLLYISTPTSYKWCVTQCMCWLIY